MIHLENSGIFCGTGQIDTSSNGHICICMAAKGMAGLPP